MRQIHGPVQNQNREYERRKNADSEHLYTKEKKPNIGKYLKAKRLECDRPAMCVGELTEDLFATYTNQGSWKKNDREEDPGQRWLYRVVNKVDNMMEIAINRDRWKGLVEARKRS